MVILLRMNLQKKVLLNEYFVAATHDFYFAFLMTSCSKRYCDDLLLLCRAPLQFFLELDGSTHLVSVSKRVANPGSTKVSGGIPLKFSSVNFFSKIALEIFK